MDDRQEEVQLHWSCWSPPGVPNAIHGASVAQRQRRRQRRTRAACRAVARRAGRAPARTSAPACPARKPSSGMIGRALQPAAARRGRHQVAPAVGDVEVAGVAARLAVGLHGRLAGAVGRAGGRARRRVAGRGARAAGAAGPQLAARLGPDERAALGVVVRRESSASSGTSTWPGRRTRPRGRRRRAWRPR